jgi:MFS family permease
MRRVRSPETIATPETAAPEPPPLRRQPEFLKLWAGQTISVFGDQVTILALPLTAVLTLDASAFQMGVLTALGWLPHLLFSLHAGMWLDRHGRRRQTMIAADYGRAAVLATVPLAWAFGLLSMPQLYLVAFAVGAISVMFDLSWSVIFVALVPRRDFVEANSKLFQSRALSYVAGPTIAGFLVQVLTAPIAVLGDALSFLGSAAFLTRITTREAEPEPHDPTLSTWQRLSAGLRFIFGNAVLRAQLMSVSTINFFNLMFGALFVLYATRELDVQPGLLGVLLGAGAIGGILGALVAPRMSRRLGVGRTLMIGTVLFPLPLVLVPAAGGPRALVLAFLFAAEFLSGFGVMVLDVNGNSLQAALTPDRLRSRVVGAHRTINYGVRPIGALLAGVLAAWIGVRTTLWISAIGATLAVLWLLPSPVPRIHDLPEPAP